MASVLPSSDHDADEFVNNNRVTAKDIVIPDDPSNQSPNENHSESKIPGGDETQAEMTLDSIPTQGRVESRRRSTRLQDLSGDQASGAEPSPGSYKSKRQSEKRRNGASAQSRNRHQSATSRSTHSTGRTRHRHRMSGSETLKFISICDTVTGMVLFQHQWPRWTEPRDQSNLGRMVLALYQFASTVKDEEISCVNFEQSPLMTLGNMTFQDTLQANNGILSHPNNFSGSISHTLQLAPKEAKMGGMSHRRVNSSAPISDSSISLSAAPVIAPSTGGTSSAPRRSTNNTRRRPEAMQMLVTHDEIITVAVFYEIPNSTITHSDTQDLVRKFMEECKIEFSRLYRTQVEVMGPELQKFASGDGESSVLTALQDVYKDFIQSVNKFQMVCFGDIYETTTTG